MQLDSYSVHPLPFCSLSFCCAVTGLVGPLCGLSFILTINHRLPSKLNLGKGEKQEGFWKKWSFKPKTYDTQEHGRVPSMVPAHTVCTDDHQLRLLLHIVLQLPFQVYP